MATASDSAASTTADRGPQLLTVSIVLLVLEVVFFGLRVTSRILARAPVGSDDVFVGLALLFALGLDACLIVMVVQGGAGQYADRILATKGPKKLTLNLQLQPAGAELYFAAMAFSKLSILSLYLRIFVQRRWRVVCRVLQVIMVAYSLGYFISILTVCRPMRALWSLTPSPDFHCGNISALETYVSVPNIVTDVIMLLLPFGMVWKIQMSVKDKIAVGLMLCAGGMGLVVSCLRFHVFFENNESTSSITYVAGTIGIYTCLEVGGYFIAACVPVLKPIFTYIGRVTETSMGSFLLKSWTNKQNSEASGADSEKAQHSSRGSNESFATTLRPVDESNQAEIAGASQPDAKAPGAKGTYVAQVNATGSRDSTVGSHGIDASADDIVVQYNFSVTSEKRH